MKIYFILFLYLCATNGKHFGNSKIEVFDPQSVTSEPANGSTVNKQSKHIIVGNSLEVNRNRAEVLRLNHNSTTDFNQLSANIDSQKQPKKSSPAWYTSNKIHDSNSPTVGVTNLNTAPEIIQGNNLSGENQNSSTQIKNQSTKSVFEDRPHKPRIIVTFLSTSKVERNHSEPVFIDPFQRILQFFLSTFIRDLTEPKFPFDRDEHRIPSCGHGHGFSCPRCLAGKRETNNNTVLNLLSENTELQKTQEKGPDVANNTHKQDKRSSDNLSPQEISNEIQLRNHLIPLTTQESSNITLKSAQLQSQNSINPDPKLLNQPTSPNTAGNLENQIINYSNQELSNYIRLGRSNTNFTHNTQINPVGLLNLTDHINTRKHDGINYTSSNINQKQIDNMNIGNNSQSSDISGDISSNFSHDIHQNNPIDLKPKVILHEYYINSRNPRDAVRLEDFSSANHSSARNATLKTVVIDGRTIMLNLKSANLSNNQESSSNVRNVSKKVHARDLHLHMDASSSESNLTDMEGVNLQKLMKYEHIATNTDKDLQYGKDLVTIEQRLIRDTNTPIPNATLQKVANNAYLQQSIVSKEHQADILLPTNLYQLKSNEESRLKYLNPEQQLQDSIISRTQRHIGNEKFLAKDTNTQHTIEDVNLHQVEELKEQQSFESESSILLNQKNLMLQQSTKEPEQIVRNLRSPILLSSAIIKKDLSQPNAEESINHGDGSNLPVLNQQGQEESSIIYANVNEGVVSIHNPNLRNQTNNLTGMKYYPVNEKRATPLIEIVNMKSNEMTNGSMKIILDQEAKSVEAFTPEINIEAKYVYTTSGDGVKILPMKNGDGSIPGVKNEQLYNIDRNKRSTATEKDPTIPTPKRLNHYFLSISGDAEKSVAAADDSDSTDDKTRISITGGDSNLRLLSSDPEANVDLNLSDGQYNFDYLRNVVDKATVEPPVDEEQTEQVEVDLPPPLEEDVKKPPTLYYSKMYYVFTVTIPVVIAVGLFMGGLCFCLRSSGLFCRLFLTEPALEIKN